MVRRFLVLLLLFCGLQFSLLAQCVIINEIVIDAAGTCDGSCAPETEEWVELYNTCNTPVDISCFVLFDGDFSLRFPAGTTIPANSHFVIGSINSGVPINLDWANCSCTTNNSEVGIFTNDTEQLVLLNNNAIVQDAILWGAGQLPVSVNSPAAGCNPINTSFNAGSGIFELIAIDAGDNGCSYARACDGSSDWEMRCTTEITAGATNGLVGFVDFDVSDATVCAGDCVSFSNLSTAQGNIYSWTFEGATIASSSLENPTGICYTTPGTFDVSLTISGTCGAITETFPDFISVSPSAPPIVNAAGLTTFCEGQFVNLLTGAAGPYQWFVDGSPIPFANDFNLLVISSGSYTLEIGSGCGAISVPMEVVVTSTPLPTISAIDFVVCDGETETLSTEVFTSYQWLLEGVPISGANGLDLVVQNTGNYSVEVTNNGGCSGISSEVFVEAVDAFVPQILPVGNQIICEGTSIALSASEVYDGYQWLLNGTVVGSDPTFVASDAGNYTLEANILGCLSTSNATTISIELAPVGSINALGSTTFCEGGLVNLQANGNHTSLQWLLNGTPIESVSNTIVANVEGNYEAVLLSPNNCETITNSIPVDILVVPSSQILQGSSIVSCIPEVSIDATGGNTYIWQFNGATIPGQIQSTLNVTLEGTYSVVAVGSNGCTSSPFMTEINFLDAPVVDITASEDTVCVGEAIVLQVPAIYESTLWSTGETLNLIYVEESGEYFVTVRDENNCETTDSIEVVVSPLPFIDVPAVVQSDCVQGAVVEAFSDGFIAWSLDNYIEVVSPNMAIANPARNATFTITAVLNDCITIVPVRVNVECSTIFIPNSFTPDNDGVNDFFSIIANDILSYELIIFNRFGEVLFRSTNPDEGWDGGIDGYYVPDGVYNYSLQALDKYGNPIFDNPVTYGTVTIIR